MRFEGRVFRVGRHWAVEVPILDVVSQGRTKKEALKMIADAVESLVNRPGFTLKVFPGTGEHFEVTSEDQPTLSAFLLRRVRQRAGLSLAQVAERLGATSINAYARYEQGRSVPTIQKLSELFAAVMPHRDLVLVESET
ncbi:MAG: helix-turn-helix domain-containing protein [candidate division NC10 bacterium]|nr:helix-turn-helix domain-containing protein [candidate division NC10 bacterium]MDE2322012.1 helix-turn-helix domain-containing protein [candidate division NC10 bacterium]